MNSYPVLLPIILQVNNLLAKLLHHINIEISIASAPDDRIHGGEKPGSQCRAVLKQTQRCVWNGLQLPFVMQGFQSI